MRPDTSSKLVPHLNWWWPFVRSCAANTTYLPGFLRSASILVVGKGVATTRKDYGMNKGIPFVTIADRVEVTVDLKAKRISGPPVVLKQ